MDANQEGEVAAVTIEELLVRSVNQILLADMLVALNVPFIEGKRLSRRHHLAGVKSGTMGREDTLASLRWE